MSAPKINCTKPLADGGPCHACRIYLALVEAERAVEPCAVAAGMMSMDRCLDGLADAAANFLADLDDDTAKTFVARLYVLSRRYREDQRADALAHPVGHA